MELKIFWTDFAKNELQKNFKYLKENASLRVARNETRKIVTETLRLLKQPEIGQIEELLADSKLKFRYLVHQTYKIIYWINIDKNQIEIVDIFDTQQYPTKIRRSKQ
ncbi:type II toxin-antitoxin system RelE/ParE family toxin [Zunongwangia sp. F260]|uniref:Type II toxin-antitoxin system RelE/ParE family toxin n=1 Tax=Autumnicola lenta TaxID=3075593 RepID=A0ABU3CG52_9FLAO|nr:type II toxin-antitoxin system RelE/ParE family toxin [Zunongwangia sp. F260]MDT0645238.1 type II toxin-antitoxin system RelE/ParE family toxin [Zunongwangia sp. F260]